MSFQPAAYLLEPSENILSSLLDRDKFPGGRIILGEDTHILDKVLGQPLNFTIFYLEGDSALACGRAGAMDDLFTLFRGRVREAE